MSEIAVIRVDDGNLNYSICLGTPSKLQRFILLLAVRFLLQPLVIIYIIYGFQVWFLCHVGEAIVISDEVAINHEHEDENIIYAMCVIGNLIVTAFRINSFNQRCEKNLPNFEF